MWQSIERWAIKYKYHILISSFIAGYLWGKIDTRLPQALGWKKEE